MHPKYWWLSGIYVSWNILLVFWCVVCVTENWMSIRISLLEWANTSLWDVIKSVLLKRGLAFRLWVVLLEFFHVNVWKGWFLCFSKNDANMAVDWVDRLIHPVSSWVCLLELSPSLNGGTEEGIRWSWYFLLSVITLEGINGASNHTKQTLNWSAFYLGFFCLNFGSHLFPCISDSVLRTCSCLNFIVLTSCQYYEGKNTLEIH